MDSTNALNTTKEIGTSLIGGRTLFKKDKWDNPLFNKLSTKHTGDINRVEEGAIVNHRFATESKVAATSMDTTIAVDLDKKANIWIEEDSLIEISKDNIEKGKNNLKEKLYYSIVIGPDLSTVKFQKASNVGYSVGLMIGHQFNRKFAIEGGVIWDKKNYYTDGEYFDTSRLQLPLHSKVLKADGYCYMIEIPVNVKFYFGIQQSRSFFISGGVSSYLMKKEDYKLSYERYNQQYVKEYGYKNSSKDWMSVMNLSFGYQKSLGKRTNVYIAPYAKVPLKGVGIGKVPITSAGLDRRQCGQWR